MEKEKGFLFLRLPELKGENCENRKKNMKKWEGSNGFQKRIKCFYLRIVGHRKSFEKLFYYHQFLLPNNNYFWTMY